MSGLAPLKAPMTIGFCSGFDPKSTAGIEQLGSAHFLLQGRWMQRGQCYAIPTLEALSFSSMGSVGESDLDDVFRHPETKLALSLHHPPHTTSQETWLVQSPSPKTLRTMISSSPPLRVRL